mmetsp:Transcript_90730/g.181026  ORF Transcript_90730/g.181026 Transcript_90730/m.181026 type:complete len:86 (-) Transcript_90730:253-510(-)
MRSWEDMLGAAIAVLNSIVRLYSRDKQCKRKSPNEIVTGNRPDLFVFQAPPGSHVNVHIEKSKANMGDFKSKPAILIRPAGTIER